MLWRQNNCQWEWWRERWGGLVTMEQLRNICNNSHSEDAEGSRVGGCVVDAGLKQVFQSCVKILKGIGAASGSDRKEIRGIGEAWSSVADELRRPWSRAARSSTMDNCEKKFACGIASLKAGMDANNTFWGTDIVAVQCRVMVREMLKFNEEDKRKMKYLSIFAHFGGVATIAAWLKLRSVCVSRDTQRDFNTWQGLGRRRGREHMLHGLLGRELWHLNRERLRSWDHHPVVVGVEGQDLHQAKGRKEFAGTQKPKRRRQQSPNYLFGFGFLLEGNKISEPAWSSPKCATTQKGKREQHRVGGGQPKNTSETWHSRHQV